MSAAQHGGVGLVGAVEHFWHKGSSNFHNSTKYSPEHPHTGLIVYASNCKWRDYNVF